MGGPPISVSGGRAGIAADCARLVAVAGQFGAVAGDTAAAAVALHGYLVTPAVVLSATLDPPGFADFEGELLLALDGWQGLGWAAAACGGIDAELRAAAAAYAEADRLAGDVHDVLVGGWTAVPALYTGLAVLAGTRNPMRAAEAVIAADPELADDVLTALGIPALLTATARAVPDGYGVARPTGEDSLGVAGVPPRRLTDLLGDLAQRTYDLRHGEIDVRILTLPDGSRRAIVDVTGTKSWDPLPTSDITSLSTNGRALVGAPTAYEQGVLRAMHRAGVRPGDDVMLVGHSQGGMVAVTAARDAVERHEFKVTHVVTAGSPIGLSAGTLPAGVQLLALENSRDVVPHLDGRANPDRPNLTTVTGAHGDGTVIGDHDITGAYLPLAADAQVSGNRSIRAFLRSAAGYFRASSVVTHTYQIQRRY